MRRSAAEPEGELVHDLIAADVSLRYIIPSRAEQRHILHQLKLGSNKFFVYLIQARVHIFSRSATMPIGNSVFLNSNTGFRFKIVTDLAAYFQSGYTFIILSEESCFFLYNFLYRIKKFRDNFF